MKETKKKKKFVYEITAINQPSQKNIEALNRYICSVILKKLSAGKS